MNFEIDLKNHTKIPFIHHDGARYVFYVQNSAVDMFNTILKNSDPKFVLFDAAKFANFVIRNNEVLKARYEVEEVFDAALVEFQPAIQTI